MSQLCWPLSYLQSNICVSSTVRATAPKRTRASDLRKPNFHIFPCFRGRAGIISAGLQPRKNSAYQTPRVPSRLKEPTGSIELRGNTLSTEPRALHSDATHSTKPADEI